MAKGRTLHEWDGKGAIMTDALTASTIIELTDEGQMQLDWLKECCGAINHTEVIARALALANTLLTYNHAGKVMFHPNNGGPPEEIPVSKLEGYR